MESCGYPDPIPSLCTSRNRLGNRFQDASRAALQAGSSIMDGRIAGALSFPFSLSLSLSLSSLHLVFLFSRLRGDRRSRLVIIRRRGENSIPSRQVDSPSPDDSSALFFRRD